MSKHQKTVSLSAKPAIAKLRKPGISAFPAPFSAGDLAEGLGLFPAFQWLQGIPPRIRIKTLRVHPEGPKSFGIVLYTDGGWQSLIGKVYPSNRQDLYQVLEGLK